MLELWRPWWPERVCVEFLGDKIQAGYDALERREAASAAAVWLDAWSDVVRLCDLTGIDSIREFDNRFSMYQSLFNWSQGLEDALWNAGREDPEFLRARIAVCEEALRRFPDEDELMVENRRRAVAESYFELGETDRAEALFEQWLAADPRWGWGWIGWADLYFFTNNRPKDYRRAEELLRRGYSMPGAKDREDIADRLVLLYRETGRDEEAEALAGEAKRISRSNSGVSVRRAINLEDAGDRAVVRDTTTATFEGEGLPLDRLTEIVEALDAARGTRGHVWSNKRTSSYPLRMEGLRSVRAEQPRWDVTLRVRAGAAGSTRSAAALALIEKAVASRAETAAPTPAR